MDISRFGASPGLDDFIEAVTDRCSPASAAAFAACILREYDPDEPRDERGRWTIDGSAAQKRIDAAFAVANQKFPVYDRRIETYDMKDLDAKTRDLVEKRNRFLVESGIFKGDVPAVNIGGESDGELGTRGAINVNVASLGSGFNSGKPVPRLYLREGENSSLPFGTGTVRTIVSKDTPIEVPTAKEIARIIAPGGTISLSGPDHPAVQQIAKRVFDAVGLGKLSQSRTVENGVPILKTTIVARKWQ